MIKAGVIPAFFLLLYRDFVPGGVFFGALGTFWQPSVPAALILGTKRVCFVPGGVFFGAMGTFWHSSVPAAAILGTKRVCFVPGGGYSGTVGTFWRSSVPARTATVLFFCKQVLFL